MSSQRRVGGVGSGSSGTSDDSGDEGRDLQHHAVAAAGRRDENAISFRHFLQPQSDVVPTRHLPATTARGTRNTAPVDLVDIPGGLPDFVQDHLVMEAQIQGNDAQDINAVPIPNPASPLDLAAVEELMPVFLSPGHRGSQNPVNEGLEELGAYGPTPSGTLPDFLSDGPMHYDATTANSMENSVISPGGGRLSARCTTGSLGRSQSRESSQNHHALLQQIETLTSQLQQRDRRIAQMEQSLASQNAELQRLYSQLAKQSTSREDLPPVANAGAGGESSTASTMNSNRSDAPQDIGAIATRAESLLTELMKEIQRLKRSEDK